MRKRIVSADIIVPDDKRIIVAARHVPDTWPVIDQYRLDTFAAAYPEWDYMLAGEQVSNFLRHGSRLLHGASVVRW